MRAPHVRRAALITCTIFLVAACSEERQDVGVGPVSTPAVRVDVSTVSAHPGEEHFSALSRFLPGYGGHYLDNRGRLVLLLTDTSWSPRARQIVTSRLFDESYFSDPTRRSLVTTRLVKYTYVQLSNWRDSIRLIAATLPDVISLDLDEEANRVVLEVASDISGASQSLRNSASDIPADAIIIQRGKPARGISLSQLNDAAPDTIAGGVATTGSGICTIGLTVD